MVRSVILSPKLLIAIPLLLVLLIAVACGDDATNTPVATSTPRPTATPAPTATPEVMIKSGGIIKMQSNGSFGANWTPYEAASGYQHYGGIYNQLVEYNPETDDPFDLRGDLAESWSLSSNGRTYTFNIASDAKWHDGTDVTAADIVASMDELIRDGAARPQVSILKPYYATGNTSAVDGDTAAVTLKRPFGGFLNMMALDFFKMLSKDWLAKGADHTTVWENGMGSGPFTPGDLVKDVSISLERNPNYFKEGLPYVDGYTQFVISDASTAISAFQTGQVFMSIWGVTNISGAQSEKLEADTNGRIKDFFIPDAQIEGLAMNQKKDTPVSDVRVRRALFLAVHRPAFVEAFGGSQGQVGTPFPPGSWFGRSLAQVNDLPGYRVTANGEKHPDDIKAATDLLAAAGFDDGNKLKIDLLIRQTAGRQDIAALVKDQLERSIPVEITLIPIDPSAGIQAYIAGDYEVAMEGTAVPLAQPDPIMSKIYMPGGLWAAWAGWDTPDSFVTLFNQQSEELDESARAALVRQIEDFILNEDPGPTIPLFWKPWDWLVNVEEVNNFHTSPSLFAQFKYEHLWLTNP